MAFSRLSSCPINEPYPLSSSSLLRLHGIRRFLLVENGFIIIGKKFVCVDIKAVTSLMDSFHLVKEILIAIAPGDGRAGCIQMDFLAIECIGEGYGTGDGGPWRWKAKRKEQTLRMSDPGYAHSVAKMLIVLWELSPRYWSEIAFLAASIYRADTSSIQSRFFEKA